MSIQFIEEMLQDVARELSAMPILPIHRMRLLELGIIRMYLINKQDELYTEMEGEES